MHKPQINMDYFTCPVSQIFTHLPKKWKLAGLILGGDPNPFGVASGRASDVTISQIKTCQTTCCGDPLWCRHIFHAVFSLCVDCEPSMVSCKHLQICYKRVFIYLWNANIFKKRTQFDVFKLKIHSEVMRTDQGFLCWSRSLEILREHEKV